MRVSAVRRPFYLGLALLLPILATGCAPAVTAHRFATADVDLDGQAPDNAAYHLVYGYVPKSSLADAQSCAAPEAQQSGDSVYAATLCDDHTAVSYAYVKSGAKAANFHPDPATNSRLARIAVAEAAPQPAALSEP